MSSSLPVAALTCCAKATRELRRTGFRILPDDSGMGYSSINLSCRIQVDTSEPDKSFPDQAFILRRKHNLNRRLLTNSPESG